MINFMNKSKSTLNCDGLFKPLREDEKEWLINTAKGTAPNVNKFRQKTIKYCTKKVQDKIFDIVNSMIVNKQTPPFLKLCNIIPVVKKGKNPHLPSSYCPISLLDTIYKLGTKIITKRIEELINPRISLGQIGGRKQYNTHSRIFTILNCISQSKNDGKDVYIIANDISKAYDNVTREGFVFGGKFLGIPENISNHIFNLIDNTTINFHNFNSYSSGFILNHGIKQGDTLSPLIFKIVIEPLVQFLESKTEGINFLSPLTQFSTGAWIDDLTCITNNVEEVENICNLQEEYLYKFGMNLDYSKTIFISNKSSFFVRNDQIIKSQKEGRILGTIINVDKNNSKYKEEIMNNIIKKLNLISGKRSILNAAQIVNTDVIPYVITLLKIYNVRNTISNNWIYKPQRQGGLGIEKVSNLIIPEIVLRIRRCIIKKDTLGGNTIKTICNSIREISGINPLFDTCNRPPLKNYDIPEYILNLWDFNKSHNIRLSQNNMIDKSSIIGINDKLLPKHCKEIIKYNLTDLTRRFASCKIIETDGSYKNGNSGYGIVGDNGYTVCSKTLGIQNVYNAEIQAIYTCCNIIKQTKHNIKIVSNSLAAVKVINNVKVSRCPYVNEIKTIIKKNSLITIAHVFGHSSNNDIDTEETLNRQADKVVTIGREAK
ncbi:hypothetical protein ABK040_002397 [Willaertia magna]